MKILFVASESVPFVKTGGLADVVGALAPVLANEGNDVRVIIPLFFRHSSGMGGKNEPCL